MLTLPSLQREYSLVFSEDPALDLPEIIELAPDAPADRVAERDKLLEQREHKLKVARETGRWHEIVKGGQSPTVFKFRPIHDDALSWLHGETVRKGMTEVEGCELAFRLALVAIDNFGSFKLKFEHHDGHRVVKAESIRPLYDLGLNLDPPRPLGRQLVLELGALVLLRGREGVPPKR